MARVFITGIDSFTGKHLQKILLKNGYEVFGLTNSNRKGSRYYYGDLLDKESLVVALQDCKPNIIIHLAALTFVALENSEEFYKINVIGTENLLNAAFVSCLNLQKVLIASSANVYGAAGVGSVSEEIYPLPVNHYANSKLAMEFMAQTYFDKLPIIITRPFNYSGVGQEVRFLIPKIVSHFAKQKNEIELGNIDVKRDFLDVRDVVNAILLLIESEFISEKYNICSGRAISISEIISQMSEIAKYDIDVIINQNFVRKNEISYLIGDCFKLKKAVNFTPQFSFKDTLTAMYFNQLNEDKC